MTNRATYYGHGLSPIDAKGRVAIPAQIRHNLVANNGGSSEIGIMPARDGQSLVCFDMPYIDMLPAQIEKDYLERKPNEPELTREALEDEAAATIESQPFDKSGRFVLSSTLRAMTGLGDLAFIYGSVRVIRIWKPETALQSPIVSANIKRTLEALLNGRAGK